MAITPLPPAVAAERDKLLKESLRLLQLEGYKAFQVRDLPGHRAPDSLLVPVWNIRVVPDIVADGDKDRRLVAWVEVSCALGEESCGRRWQALAQWAVANNRRILIVVHAEDLPRAQRIAAHWQIDPAILRPVAAI